MGQKIRTLVNKNEPAGIHSVTWDAKNDVGTKASTGIYFIRMQSSHFKSVKKVTLIK